MILQQHRLKYIVKYIKVYLVQIEPSYFKYIADLKIYHNAVKTAPGDSP